MFWSGWCCCIWSFSDDLSFIKWAVMLFSFLCSCVCTWGGHVCLCVWGDLASWSPRTLGWSWSGNACSILLNPETLKEIFCPLIWQCEVVNSLKFCFVGLLFKDRNILSLDYFFSSFSRANRTFIKCKHDSTMKGFYALVVALVFMRLTRERIVTKDFFLIVVKYT